jgi:transposase
MRRGSEPGVAATLPIAAYPQLADRGYDADWIRSLAAKRGVWANIPARCNRNEPICFSPYLYRARNLVRGVASNSR